MVLIHDPYVLIRLILKNIVKYIKVSHASLLVYDYIKSSYILAASVGQDKYRIPAGFAKIGKTCPIIVYFQNINQYRLWKDNNIVLSRLEKVYKNTRNAYLRNILQGVKRELDLYGAVVCIPCFFRKELVGIALLGKKQSGRDFTLRELESLSILSTDVAMALKNAWLFKDLKNHLAKNRLLFLNMVKALAGAIEAKDKYTIGHTERVTVYALKILDEVYNLGVINKAEYLKMREDIKVAGLLHDIGKIGVPEAILNKTAPLTEEERKKIQEHPLIGYNIIKSIKEIKNASLAVKYHHERYDGKGYPRGLKGARIPFIAGIIAVADAFDAMTTNRPYRRKLPVKKAVREISNNKARQFNPIMVEAFLNAYRKKTLKQQKFSLK